MDSKFSSSFSQRLPQRSDSMSLAAERAIASSRSSPLGADTGEAVPDIESTPPSRVLQRKSSTGLGGGSMRLGSFRSQGNALSSFRRSSMMDAALAPMLESASTAAGCSSHPNESNEAQRMSDSVDKVTICQIPPLSNNMFNHYLMINEIHWMAVIRSSSVSMLSGCPCWPCSTAPPQPEPLGHSARLGPSRILP